MNVEDLKPLVVFLGVFLAGERALDLLILLG